MINLSRYLSELLKEDLHPELMSILSDEKESPLAKYTFFLKKARSLDSRGEKTGLETSTPNRGSSRAVFVPSEPRTMVVDGHTVPVKTVYKLAMFGDLDRYKNHNEPLLGELQNSVEGNEELQQSHSILRKKPDGTYETNEHGILVPVFSVHPKFHHLEMGFADTILPTEFRRITKSEDFPNGFQHNHFREALLRHYNEANGRKTRTTHDEQTQELLMKHPLIENAIHMIANSGIHPSDFHVNNVGVWTHPVTGKDHIVVRDYGASADVLKRYTLLRTRRDIAEMETNMQTPDSRSLF